MTTRKVRNLPVTLTDEERAQRSLRFADAVQRKLSIVAELQKQNQIIYREKKELDAEIATLSKTVATGVEVQEVEVREQKDLNRRVIEVIRMDTEEIIDSRQLTIEETQDDLPFARQQGEHSVSYTSNGNGAAPGSAPTGRKKKRANVPDPTPAPPLETAPLDA